TARQVNDEVLRWLPEAGDHPWFVFVNYFDAHGPYFPPEPFNSLFADASSGRYWIGDGGADASAFSEVELTELRDRYDNAIAYADYQLEQLLFRLEARGELNNTMVIVTSDHGELFGEGGRVGHGAGRHLHLVHVPLVILPPGGPGQSLRVSTPVTLRDVPATVTSMTHPGEPSPFPGRPLSRFWVGEGRTGQPLGIDTVVAENGGSKFVVTDRYYYSYEPAGNVERLYDLVADPLVAEDISRSPRGRTVITDFRAYLRDHGLYIRPTSAGDSTRLPWR
ncbi:MAG: sulfatase-like hydrolase/transferase, partial [Halobacteriales archaeon]|nr:sulfatase-like hydrolase/transferase [Halobacteriales archaeon]